MDGKKDSCPGVSYGKKESAQVCADPTRRCRGSAIPILRESATETTITPTDAAETSIATAEPAESTEAAKAAEATAEKNIADVRVVQYASSFLRHIKFSCNLQCMYRDCSSSGWVAIFIRNRLLFFAFVGEMAVGRLNIEPGYICERDLTV